jgi:lipoprotein-anchoring transpeptidase ErfK/SrfK
MRKKTQRPRPRRLLPALCVAAVLVAMGLGLAFLGAFSPAASEARSTARGSSPGASAVPDPVSPAFVPPTPRRLRGLDHVSTFSPVRRATLARSTPDRASPVVAGLDTRTPEGTDNIVLVLQRAQDADGRVWVRVRLPVLPSNTTGWVPRAALGGYGTVRTHLVIDLDRFSATLYRRGRVVLRAPVGVGRPEWPTPRGEFYVRNKLTRYANAFYGPIAFGTSARSAVLTDWPAGGFVGIHGTNQPELLPGRVSHGCIRLRNGDLVELARLMPVGTPLTVR